MVLSFVTPVAARPSWPGDAKHFRAGRLGNPAPALQGRRTQTGAARLEALRPAPAFQRQPAGHYE